MDRRLSTILCCLLAGVAACGGSSTAPPPPDPMAALVGLYHLRTVNGAPLPYVQSSQMGTVTSIASGTLALRADSVFVQSTITTVTNPLGTTIGTSAPWGTYRLAGSRLTLAFSYSSGGYRLEATVRGDTIALSDGPRASLYVRQP